MTATHLKAHGSKVQVTPKNNVTFTLEELQAFVGGYIEFVHLPHNMVLVANEEGLLMGLPPNLEATKIAQGYTMIAGHIVGDCLLTPKKFLD